MAKKQSYQKIASYEARKGEVKKIVLLYSGSMYTSVLIKWLQDTYKAEVIALLVDIGQRNDLEAYKNIATSLGAKAVVVDAKERFAKEYLLRALYANAKYQDKYHMLSALSRPLLATIAMEVAESEGASAIAHGCSAQSNDQIRIDGTILALNPDMKVIAPLRDESFFKIDAQKLAFKYKIPQEYSTNGYSYDENLWGVSIIGGDIENRHIPARIEHLLKISSLPENAPEVAERISIDFEKGSPVGLNEKKMSFVEIIEKLTHIGGKHGIGLSYHIEDMILGLKGRSIEEEPAATILVEAHKELEQYVSSRAENEFKSHVDTKWSYLCYEGKWHEPLMEDLDSLIGKMQEKVTGKVYLRIYRGNIEIISIQSPKSVFEKRLSEAANTGIVNHRAIAGYIELSTLPMQLATRAEKTILLSIGKRTNKFKLLPQLKALDRKKVQLYATYKTHKFLKAQGIEAILVNKIHQPHLKPNLIDLMDTNRIDLIINIPSTKTPTKKEIKDRNYIAEKAKGQEIPFITSTDEAEKVLEELKS